eukprot:CAMPEP_0181444676 /NCGR_PEP_ID=MMETSP1110-20121109/25194_1 /TAXON_ID=174948 /ORGANISM="Symbiodinium sp., Strain CCMP421" /LENGTH=91 /DNA_ID=CAMNT_0023568695 /DNA_START=756 /DNA_END=1031 /DNA_ORIENTATION=+
MSKSSSSSSDSISGAVGRVQARRSIGCFPKLSGKAELKVRDELLAQVLPLVGLMAKLQLPQPHGLGAEGHSTAGVGGPDLGVESALCDTQA